MLQRHVWPDVTDKNNYYINFINFTEQKTQKTQQDEKVFSQINR